MRSLLNRFFAWGSVVGALLLLGWGAYLISKNTPRQEPGVVRFSPPTQPALPVSVDGAEKKSGTTRFIGGIGIVEPAGEAISIGTEVPGIVRQVNVKPGDKVAKGDVLFVLDDRRAQAELAIARANLNAAKVKLLELESEIGPAQAKVGAAEAILKQLQADLENARAQLTRAKLLQNSAAISAEEVDQRGLAVTIGVSKVAEAEARLGEAQGNLNKLAGANGAPTLEVQRIAIEQAEANVVLQEVALQMHTIGAPMDATVLQVRVRVGEYAPAAVLNDALMVLGVTDPLHVRVDIDESEIPRFHPGAIAYASVRGRSEVQVPLTYVRSEPYVIPKRTLGGGVSERVDTRVLQLIYSVSPTLISAIPGQQVDVYIEERIPPIPAQ